MGNDAPALHLKSVALPTEHGGWALLVEPMLLGMLAAPSLAGAWLCVAALGGFLLHQPVKIAITDHRRGRRFKRTRWAEGFIIAYGALALVGIVGAFVAAPTPFWMPLIIALPTACIQLAFEARNQGRRLLPELLGGITLSATAPMIALAAGVPIHRALLLWLLIILCILPSIMYVQVRLRAAKGKPVSATATIMLHIGVLIVTVLLTMNESVNAFSILAAALLLARAVYGLRVMPPTPPKVIGMQEIGFGLGYVVLSALAVV